MGQNDMPVFKLHLEHGIGKRLDNSALKLNGIFSFGHKHHFPYRTKPYRANIS